jgi:hypothetical protein
VRALASGQVPAKDLGSKAGWQALRCTILLSEAPYPPTHGGLLDCWNRLVALRRLGTQLQVVVWTDGAPLPSPARDIIRDLGCTLETVERTRRPLRFLLAQPPGRLDSFLPSARKLGTLVNSVTAFKPHLIVAETLDPCLPATLLSQSTGAALVYRSQNVEHLYWRFQRRLARGWAKLPFLLAEPGLEHAERSFRARADLVLDISMDDRDWWLQNGEKSLSIVMPPIWLPETSAQTLEHEPTCDVSFTGNLYAPNNVDALEWLLAEVTPRAEAQLKRRLRIVVAGAAPTRHVRELCRQHGIQCIASPQSLEEIRVRSRVLVNPVRHSSGINMKMLDMLASGRPIVSTLAGVRGLPAALCSEARVCSNAEDFAVAVATLVDSPTPRRTSERRELLERECGISALRSLLSFAEQRSQ